MAVDAVTTIRSRIQSLTARRDVELRAVGAKYMALLAELNSLLVELGGSPVDVPGDVLRPVSVRRPKPEMPPEVRRPVKSGPAGSPPAVGSGVVALKKKLTGQ